jgi:hypothetical protein
MDIQEGRDDSQWLDCFGNQLMPRNTRNAVRQLEEHITNGCAMAGEEENTEVTTFLKRITQTL